MLEGLSSGPASNEAGEPAIVDAATSHDAGTVTAQMEASSADSSPTEVYYDDGSTGTSHDAARDPSDAARDAAAGCRESCGGKGYCFEAECVYASCKDRLAAEPSSASGVYLVDPDRGGGDPPFATFCKMDLAGGGWTLLMKIDGSKSTFHFASDLWENTMTLRPESADLEMTEAKLRSYVTLPFAALLVGMRDSSVTRWTVLSVGGSSLRDLMAGSYQPTALGRSSWLKLPGTGTLQPYCNREGVNVITDQTRIRLGIVANQQDNCSSCDSFIGFGGQIGGLNMACGNLAFEVPNAYDIADDDFGYVMAR
ncbi:MAG TPA: fibrinogen-like YCDxxxxGGGW domain-containing protein [Polyangiaceae bacterium]|nr:fibrinogen-like YCDxxxxGGGW domain-containing protein [Polyangiaceae bacterium]